MDNQPGSLGLEAGKISPGIHGNRVPSFGHLRQMVSYVEPPLIFTGVFLLFIVVRYMNWGARRGIFAAIRFEFLLGVFLGIACAVVLSDRALNIRPAQKVLFSLGALFMAIIVQLPLAADPPMASFVFQERVIKYAMLTFFMVVLIQSPRILRWFLYAFLFACFYVTQESVQGLISGGLYWENQGVMRLHGSVRMYAHPNSLSGLAMGAIPFVIFLFPVFKQKIIRLGLFALLCTSVVCVIYSGSRTAYVALLAFAFFWWAISPHKFRFLLIGMVFLVIGYSVLPAQYKGRFKSITGKEAEGNSKGARIQIMKDAMVVFQANPLGVGVASFPAVRNAMFGKRQDTHNLYLEVATNLGFQGFIIFLIFVGTLFWGYHHAYRSMMKQKILLLNTYKSYRPKGPLKRLLGGFTQDLDMMIAVCRATAGFIFVRIILGFFGMDLYEVYWWFGAGLAMAILNLDNISKPKTLALVEMVKMGVPTKN